jgi:hypothetical protein
MLYAFSVSNEKDILSTIELLSKRVSGKEEEINKLKKLINELCGEAGIPLKFQDVSENESGVSIRSDQFYGQTLNAALRTYLEQRKNLGAASVSEIYVAIRDGGYKFETKSEDIARISLANALRKTSSIFHKLPNGKYGLLSWYPSAKAKPEPENDKPKKHNRTKKLKLKRVTTESPTAPPLQPENKTEEAPIVTNNEIRELVLARAGEFSSSDIFSALKEKYPTKTLSKTKVPTVLFILKGKGLVKEVSPKAGSKPAVYSKA